jgi:hypothetical protein
MPYPAGCSTNTGSPRDLSIRRLFHADELISQDNNVTGDLRAQN